MLENFEGSNFKVFYLTLKILSLKFCQKSTSDRASLLQQLVIAI